MTPRIFTFFAIIGCSLSLSQELPEGTKVIPLCSPAVHPSASENDSPPILQDTPEHAARAYLDFLSEGIEVPDSLKIISPYTKESKKTAIKARQTAVAALLSKPLSLIRYHKNNPKYEIIGTAADGDMAVVTFSVHNADVPLTYHGSSLTLVKTGGMWRIAPLPDSFENAGLPFDRKIRSRAEKLTENINSAIAKNITAKKQSALEKFLSEVHQRREANKGKSTEALLYSLGEAVRQRNFIEIAALLYFAEGGLDFLVENGLDVKPIIPQGAEEFINILRKMNMINDQVLTLRRADSSDIFDLASRESSIIVPIDDPPPNPDQNAIPKTATEHMLGGIIFNMIPLYTMHGPSGYACTVKIPLMRIENSDTPLIFNDTSDSLYMLILNEHESEQVTEQIRKNFSKYYPPLEFPSPEDAAKSILCFAREGDIASLMRSIDPAFINDGNADTFMSAAIFLRNLILSSQQLFPEQGDDSIEDLPLEATIHQTQWGSFIVNPQSPAPDSACVYVSPDGKTAITLANLPNPDPDSDTPSTVKFKMARQPTGNWTLSFPPGPFPLLGENVETAPPSLTGNRADIKNIVTVNPNDPFLQACQKHFSQKQAASPAPADAPSR